MHGRRHGGGGCARCGPGALPGHATAPARPTRPRLRGVLPTAAGGQPRSVCVGPAGGRGVVLWGGGDGGGRGRGRALQEPNSGVWCPPKPNFLLSLMSCQVPTLFSASRADGVSDGDESRRGHGAPDAGTSDGLVGPVPGRTPGPLPLIAIRPPWRLQRAACRAREPDQSGSGPSAPSSHGLNSPTGRVVVLFELGLAGDAAGLSLLRGNNSPGEAGVLLFCPFPRLPPSSRLQSLEPQGEA